MLRPMILLLALSTLGLTEIPAADKTTRPPKRYRVIFNSDGHGVFKDAKGDLGQWINNLFGPLENSQVDALFWCDGAGGNTANYDSQVLERNGARSGKIDPALAKLIAEGNDPPRVVVREARKRKLDVFYSFRVNDIHDAFLTEERPTFKVKHPEWLIGKKKYGNVTSYETALNFAVKEVRDLKFRVVEEIFAKYEFDGLELDLLRSAPYFLPGTEQKNAALMTGWISRIRKHLQQRARQRKRPIRLAIRVDESLAACQSNGFDIPAWLAGGLTDYLVLGSGVIDIEIGEFKRLAAPRGVPVYPCLYGWPSRYSPISRPLAAATALTYWHQGADGIYLFNWFPHTKNNSENNGAWMAGMLDRLGDPALLRTAEPRLMFAVDRGRPSGEYPYNWLHCVLPETLVPNTPLALRLRIGEDLATSAAATTITIQVQVDHLQAGDRIAVSIGNKPLTGWKPAGKDRLQADVDAGLLRQGDNRVSLALTRRADSSGKPRIARAVELHVRRRK
ncbi:MAG: family 10 glycosylhydrolase [Planctomycetaceae bacterium]|jgi:hypothetical protein|nr:family 10 glycosylhydrolase [Planctomycetaceae bacterium]